MDSVDQIEVKGHCDSFDETISSVNEEVSREVICSVSLEGFEFYEDFGDFSVFEWSVDFVAKSRG